MSIKDILTFEELSPKQIIRILDLADKYKEERKKRVFRKELSSRILALIFQKSSTRTRISFEIAMKELGGEVLSFSANDLQLSRGETIEDSARVFSRYVDIVMLRVYKHKDIIKFANASSIPVINGLSDLYHPCQTLADLQTIREIKGYLKKLKIAWIGDGNNVANSLILACSKMDIQMVIACPKSHQPSQDVISYAKSKKAKILITSNSRDAAHDADVVITDTFVSMGQEKNKKERLKIFLPKYQVNQKLMTLAKKDAIFMHCLPAHRGEEVTSEVLDGPQSAVWEEAENRLHSQKALLSLLLSNRL